MLVPFTKLPDEARIWIYQSNRRFNSEEVPEIKNKIEGFLSQWTAHQSALEAGYEVPYDRFIVLGLNQSLVAASGCSIDASVHFIQSIEASYGVDLLDRMNVTFRQGEYISFKSLVDFRQMAKARSISKNTIVFNNLVDTKEAYCNAWEVPASESWHSRFIKT